MTRLKEFLIIFFKCIKGNFNVRNCSSQINICPLKCPKSFHTDEDITFQQDTEKKSQQIECQQKN